MSTLHRQYVRTGRENVLDNGRTTTHASRGGIVPPVPSEPPPPKQAKRVTIEDVARHAGVSRAAVSRVMRDAVGASADTRRRVQAAIEDLSYRPHAGARGMRGRTYALGVMVSEITDPWHSNLVEVISAHVDKAGKQLLVGVARTDPDAESATIQALTDHGVDGLILIGPRVKRKRVEEAAALAPLVVFGREFVATTYDSVSVDNAIGMRLVLDHLVALGHRDIGHVAARPGSPASTIPALERAERYDAEMLERGLVPTAVTVPHSDTSNGGYEGALELLGAQRRPTAIVADSDVAALGVIAAAAELGVRIPEDLSLVGWGNTSIAALPPISLTTVDQDGHDVGTLLAELLLERTDQHRTAPRNIRTAPRLVERNSTGAV
jgi:LacI family transcriptional regulator